MCLLCVWGRVKLTWLGNKGRRISGTDIFVKLFEGTSYNVISNLIY